MDGTILGQGSFTAQYTLANPTPGTASNVIGLPQLIQVPSGCDWISVRNYTKSSQIGLDTVLVGGTADGVAGIEYYWQRGMPTGSAIVSYKTTGASGLNSDTITSGGFTFYAPGSQLVNAQQFLSNPVAITAITNATQPVVSTANTAGVTVGSIVRISGAGSIGFTGNFVVSAVTANTSFTLLGTSNALANLIGVAGTTGSYQIVNFDPIYYPRSRMITSISSASSAVVATSVPHQYVPGQQVRFNIPAVSGMVQLNPSAYNNYLSATVTSVIDLYTFTINVDTTGFTPFTYPTFAQQPSSYPEVVPLGENTAFALTSPASQTPTDANGNPIFNANTGILSDSTVNTSFLGILLGAGGTGTVLTTPISGPAGTVHFTAGNVLSGDVMYWLAGKSTYGGY